MVGEPFEDFARSFLPRVGPHLPGKSWLYDKLGVTRGRRSLYDELMLSLHDAAKLDDDFQKNSPRQAVDFPPGAAGWSSPTRCCMRRWAGNSRWNRPSIWMWRKWPSRRARRSGCWNG